MLQSVYISKLFCHLMISIKKLFSTLIIIRNVSPIILVRFLKDHVTLKTGEIMLKIQLRSKINYIVKYIQIENSYFNLWYYFTILQYLVCFDQIQPSWEFHSKTLKKNDTILNRTWSCLTLEDKVNSVTLCHTESKPVSLSERVINNGSNESFDTRRQLNSKMCRLFTVFALWPAGLLQSI